MNFLSYSLYFLLAALIAYLLTPWICRIALKYRVLDVPNERKRHESSKPSMGGLAIFAAFFAVLGIGHVIHEFWHSQVLVPYFDIGHVFIGALPLIVLGILDDKYRLNYKPKLLVQLGVALLMYHYGFRIQGITNPLTGNTAALGSLSLALTVFWFLFIMNAINIIDGIDGLAAGVALIAAINLLFTAIYLDNVQTAILAAILAGSISGFLRFNFYPATIFMGDTGSLFLGYLLAVLSMRGAQKGATAVALFIPVMILGLPILDVILAVIRRWSAQWRAATTLSSRVLAWKEIFKPDLQHIHHRLLDKGLSKPQTVLFLYLVAAGFGIAGFIMTAARNRDIAVMLLYMSFVFFIAFRKFSVYQAREEKKFFSAASGGPELPFEAPAVLKTPLGQGRGPFRSLLVWLGVVLIPIMILMGVVIEKGRF